MKHYFGSDDQVSLLRRTLELCYSAEEIRFALDRDENSELIELFAKAFKMDMFRVRNIMDNYLISRGTLKA